MKALRACVLIGLFLGAPYASAELDIRKDTNAKPTGGMREIQYRLVPGEAGWILKVDRVVES